MENGDICPYGEAVERPINGGCTDGADGFIAFTNRYPSQA